VLGLHFVQRVVPIIITFIIIRIVYSYAIETVFPAAGFTVGVVQLFGRTCLAASAGQSLKEHLSWSIERALAQMQKNGPKPENATSFCRSSKPNRWRGNYSMGGSRCISLASLPMNAEISFTLSPFPSSDISNSNCGVHDFCLRSFKASNAACISPMLRVFGAL